MKQSALMTTDGVRLHVTDTGTGVPVLFLHEFAGDHRSWAGQVAGLGDEFRCITYAARGYAPSDVPADPGSYSWQRAVDDAVGVIDALGLPSVHVVGLSMGAYTALQLGLSHPQRVRSIMAVSAGSGSEPETRSAFVQGAAETAALLRAQGSAAVALQLAEGPARIQLQARDEAAWRTMIDVFSDQDPEGRALTALQVQARRPSLHDLADRFASLTVPLLVVNGDEDEACLSTGLMLKRAAPSSGLLVLPNSGHVPNLEAPRQFNDITRRFVTSVEDGSWPERDPRSRAESAFGFAETDRSTATSPGGTR